MKKLPLILAALTLFLAAGVAFAADPGGHVQNAKALLNQAQAELDAAIAEPLPTVTETITQTITQTVTQTVTQTPAPTTTIPSTTTVPPTTTAPPPPSGFPSRAEALARSNDIVLSGTRSTQYKPGAATDTTYDLRGLTSTAYPFGSSFPLVIEGSGNVVIGGAVFGQQGRTLTWEQTHDPFGGTGLRLGNVNGYEVSYDFRVDNTVDGIDMLPQTPGVGPAGARVLIEGAYMTWIRDDAIEDDTEMSATIRDVLVDGVNDGISIGQSSRNANAVVNLENVLFIHAPMPNGHAADGVGHQTIFKQLPGGRVNLTNVTDCMYENPISPGRINIRPPGTWTNVTFVLGPGWVGANPSVPAGATVSRDWQGLCLNARDAWLAAH